jgi:hypothetical protein
MQVCGARFNRLNAHVIAAEPVINTEGQMHSVVLAA